MATAKDMFASLDKSMTDLKRRKTVVVGEVGSGKTCLCRYIAGEYDETNESRLSGFSVTTEIKTYRGKYLGVDSSSTQVQYTMVDSEGYGADTYTTDNLRNQLITALKFETELNCVIICVNMGRFRNGLKDDLTHLIGVIMTLGLEKDHLLFIFTHCEMYKQEKKEEYVAQFKKYYNFDFGNNYVFGCFANMSEVNENYAPFIIKDVLASVTMIRQKITEKEAMINVASKIYAMEQPK